MPKIQLPITNGFYKSRSLPISSQNCVNLYPVIKNTPALVQQSLRGTPGVEWILTNAITGEAYDGGPVVGGGGGPDGTETQGGVDGGGGGDNPDAGGTDIGDGGGPIIDEPTPEPTPRPECQPYDCAALQDAYEDYFELGVPPMIAGPLSDAIPWVGDVFADVVVATQSATNFSWLVFTDFTNGGFGPGAFGIRPVEDDITGWSLCGGIVEEGFAIDTTGAFFNNAGVFVPGRFNADSGSGVIGLGENQNVRFEGGTVFEAWLYVLADYSKSGVEDTTYGSKRVRFNIVWDTSEYVLQVEGLGSTIELSLPSGVFPTPTSNTIGFAPWNAEVSFNNYRWDLSSGRRVVCDATYRLVVDGNVLSGIATGIDLGGVVDFGVQIVPGPVTPVDPTVSAGIPTNAFGTNAPFSYFPTSFYPDFIGFIGYFILGGERTIALEDVTAFETAYARNFADYTPPGDCP
jgi:hypothetical protein